MDDDALAGLVARDLVAHLRERSASLTGPVVALSLWTEDLHAQFAVSICTQELYDRLAGVPGSVAQPNHLEGLTATVWSSAEWEVSCEEFLTASTTAALAPLSWPMGDEGDGLDDEEREAATQRWERLGYRVVEIADPLSVLVTIPSAIAYAEMPSLPTVDQARAMLRTVPASRMHELFPEWVRMAAEVRAVRSDEQRMQQPGRWWTGPIGRGCH